MPAHVFVAMGTAASIRFSRPMPGAEVLRMIEACFAAFDERYSLYRTDSEISSVARGELALTGASEPFRETYAEAITWGGITNNSFTPHRPDGVIDLSGLVKAKAIAAAGVLLRESGRTDWLLNVGGDMLTDGSNAGSPWQLGVIDPDDRQALLCALDLPEGRAAMATSGTAERGEHIWRTSPDSSYRQVTVVADDIITADVWATAILAGGPERLRQATDDHGLDVITVDVTGEITATKKMRQARGFVSP